MISIAMAYINRKRLLIETLKSIALSKHTDFEVVVVDDGSDESERIEDLMIEYPFLRVIRVEPKDKWYVSGSIPWNRAIVNCKGDIIIMQNPECLYIHDVLMFVENYINDSLYLTMGVYSLNEELTESLPEIINKGLLLKFLNSLPQRHVKDYVGWYNHSEHNPCYYPFCAALTRKNMNELGGFDERFGAGVGYEDDNFISRVSRMGLKIMVANGILVIHQWHPKVYDLANKTHEAYWFLNQFGYKLTQNETHWRVKNSYK